MSFSTEWDEAYRANRHMSQWPWSALVSAVTRHAPPHGGFRRVLELGCGVGANVPFFLEQGVDYHSVEGSKTAVAFVHERFPELSKNVVLGDYTKEIPFTGEFDLVVDRSSLTCNDTESISRCMDLLRPLLRKGGRFIAVDWFSVDHGDYAVGRNVDGRYTRTDFSEGAFVGAGDIHFFDRQHLLSFFGGYRVLTLQHETIAEECLDGETRTKTIAKWNIVAERDT